MRWPRPGMALLVLAAWPLLAADPWMRVSAPGFDFYTTAGPKQATEMVRRLENIRTFFLRASPVKKLRDVPLRVVEFGNPDEFRKYNPNSIAAAYFLATPVRDYIVLGPSAEDNFAVAVHEYVHLILRQSGIRMPMWLSEGWAEVYSTLRPQGRETAVGDLIPARMETLKTRDWLDFDTLTRTTPESAGSGDGARASIFYAESWALAHMLYLAPEYQANFGKFIDALQAGKQTGEACEAAFGRTGAQVYADLKNYFGRKKIEGRIYDASLGKSQNEPEAHVLSDVERGMMLAELLLAGGKTTDARAELERLNQAHPGQAEVARALGELALGTGDEDAARTYLESAFAAGEQDAATCFRLAVLEQKKGQVAKMLPPLERALKTRPDYTEAKVLLGLAKVDVRDFEGAAAMLLAIDEIRPDVAPAVFCGLAMSYVQTGDLDAARRHLATCRKWAKADAEVKRADQLGIFLEARAKPEAAVRKGEKHGAFTGTAVAIDCQTPVARLRVQVNDKAALFDLPSPGAIELVSKSGGQLTLKCGPLAPMRVGVEFAPPVTAIGSSAGIVRRLEF